jgi:hypothetical protein
MSWIKHVASIVGISFLVVSTAGLPVSAATTDTGVVHSYRTNKAIRQGMIVSLVPNDTTRVTPLTNQHVSDMFGVAIAPTDAPISVIGDTGAQIYVATSGQYNVLVSTQNGAIHAGDYISISALDGVGMKASATEPTILGRAAADFTTARAIQQSVPILTPTGTTTVTLGSIPISITIASNPSAGQGTGNLPGFLRIASSGIANKAVPASRVYLAMAVLLLAGFISANVLFSGIRGGVLSIGRNPLAKRSILNGVMQAVAVGVGVFIIGLFGVYLLLRL